MKKIAAILSLTALVAISAKAFAAAPADTLAEVKKKGVLVAGVKDSLPPFGYIDEKTRTIIGYDNVPANREKARELMKEAGYGPDKRLKVKVSTRNIATFRDPAVILIDQLRDVWIDGEL